MVIKLKNNLCRIYTAQSDRVIKTLDEDNYYVVKKEYIVKKYGEEIANIFLIAYNWLVKKLKKKTPKPEDAEYPIWIFKDEKYAKAYGANNLLTIDYPKNQVLFFDNKGWEQVLNLKYIPKNKKDEQNYNEKLKRYGIKNPLEILINPHYPMLKKEVLDSWERIFELNDDSIIRGAVWYIDKNQLI